MTRYALASVLVVLVAAPAHAQVDEGREALANAEFDRAIRAFDEAEGSPLDREAYVSLLEGRALASWATGDTDRARADLAKLAAIDPRHVLPREAPPELTDLLRDTVRSRGGPIAASALYTPSGDALTITVRNDDLGLVSEIRTHLRTGGAWSIVPGAPPAATVPIDAGATRAEAWVELVGPGGAVLATRGSEAAPIVWERTPGAGDSSSSSSAAGDDTALFVGLGIGGAVIAIAVVIAIVLAVSSGGSGGAQPGAPVVVGF